MLERRNFFNSYFRFGYIIVGRSARKYYRIAAYLHLLFRAAILWPRIKSLESFKLKSTVHHVNK